MNARNTLMLPLFAAIGLALLAAVLSLVSVGTLHGSLEDIAQTRLKRVQRAGRLEAARLQLAIRQQALLLARSQAEVEAAREELWSAREELTAAMDELAQVEDAAGQRRLNDFGEAVDSYFQVLDQIVPLVERSASQPAIELAQGDAEAVFREYLAAVGAVREWARDLPPPVPGEEAAALGPVAGPVVGLDPALSSQDGPAGVLEPSVPGPLAWSPALPPAVDSVEIHRTLADVVAAAWALKFVTHGLALGQRDALATEQLAAEVAQRTQDLSTLTQSLAARMRSSRPELVANLESAVERWRQVTEDVVKLAGERVGAQAEALSAGAATERLSAARAAGLEIADAAEAGANAVRQAASETYSTALVTAVPALLLAIVAAVMLGVWLSRRSIHLDPPAATDPPAANDQTASTPATSPDAGRPAPPTPEAPASLAVMDGGVTIQELTRRTDMLAAEAEMAASRVDELGKCFAAVATEVRKLAERSQSAAKEIAELPAGGAEADAKERAAVDKILSELEVMATLVIDMSAAVRAPGGADADDGADGRPSTWPETNNALDEQARSVIDAVSKLRPPDPVGKSA